MIQFPVGYDRVNDDPIPCNFVENRIGVTRKPEPTKRPAEFRSEMWKASEQSEVLVKVLGEELAAAGPVLLVMRVDGEGFTLRTQQKNYFRHALAASFRFTSSQATTRLGSRR